jgi:hypothetical protein
MINPTIMQILLDEEANLGNKRLALHNTIKKLRGVIPPVCFGEDDCSTMFLSQCPWRMDCGVYKDEIMH